MEHFINSTIAWSYENKGWVTFWGAAATLIMTMMLVNTIQHAKNTSMISAGDCQVSGTYASRGEIVTLWYCNGSEVTRRASEESVKAYIEFRAKKIEDGTWY